MLLWQHFVSPNILLLSVLQGVSSELAEVKFINSSGAEEGKTGSELSEGSSWHTPHTTYSPSASLITGVCHSER